MRESKESRFRRVAEARVNKLIKMLRLLGNCSRTGNYAYTQEQVGQIFDIEAEADALPKPEENICFINGIAVDLRALWPRDEFIETLFEAGGTVSDLSEVCERYVNLYGNELYWPYPITDGQYNGVYFVLVQEGVLCLPYYEIDKECFEIFERDGVRLLTAEELSYFISEWERYSEMLSSAMEALYKHLEMRKT